MEDVPEEIQKIIYDELEKADDYCDTEKLFNEINCMYKDLNKRPPKYEITTEQRIKSIRTMIDIFSVGRKNRCVMCGEDMGIMNPRQYCKKTYCGNFLELN